MAPTASLPWSEGPHGHGPGRSCWTPQTAVCPLWAFDAGTTCVLWHCFSASKCSVHFPRVDLHIFGCSGRRPHYIHTHTHIYIYIFATSPALDQFIEAHGGPGGRGDAIDAWGSDHWHHLELCAPRLPSGSDASSDSGCASCPFHRGAK